MASTTWQKLADLERLSRDLDARNVVFSERRVLVPSMIMGLAIGYTKSQLEPFVCSLKKTNFSGKIVLFVSNLNIETEEFLVNQGIELVSFETYRCMSFSIDCARWFRYLEYLIDCVKRNELPEAILFTDVGDVVFQGNPLEGPIAKLEFYEEHDQPKIGSCAYNSLWMRRSFGKKILRELAPFTISCAGTVIASGVGAIEYLIEMQKLMLAIPVHVASSIGADQAAHNFIVYRNIIPGAQVRSNGERVFTVSHLPAAKYGLTTNYMIATQDKTVCPIVHQYNHHREMVEAVHRRLQLPVPPLPVFPRKPILTRVRARLFGYVVKAFRTLGLSI
jgi:hypothetical protein